MISPKIVQPNSKQFQELVKNYADTHFNQPVTFGTFQQWLDEQGYEIGMFMYGEAAAQFVSILHCLYVSDFHYCRKNHRIQTIFVVRKRKKVVIKNMSVYSPEKILKTI